MVIFKHIQIHSKYILKEQTSRVEEDETTAGVEEPRSILLYSKTWKCIKNKFQMKRHHV